MGREAPCVVVNCGGGDGHGGHGGYDHDDHDDHGWKHKKKKKDCCGPCDSMHGPERFVAGVDVGFISPVATELPASLLVNPLGSGKTLVITGRTMTALGSDDFGILFRFYFNPTVTAAGAAAPITNLTPDPMAPTSVAQFTSVPTVTANGALIDAFNVAGDNAQSAAQFTLGEGQSLLVTQRSNAENTRASAFLYWSECKGKCHRDWDDDEPSPPPPGG